MTIKKRNDKTEKDEEREERNALYDDLYDDDEAYEKAQMKTYASAEEYYALQRKKKGYEN